MGNLADLYERATGDLTPTNLQELCDLVGELAAECQRLEERLEILEADPLTDDD